MATPNYGYEKRQRELAKKRKAEEKRQRKQTDRGADDTPATRPPETVAGAGDASAPADGGAGAPAP